MINGMIACFLHDLTHGTHGIHTSGSPVDTYTGPVFIGVVGLRPIVSLCWETALRSAVLFRGSGAASLPSILWVEKEVLLASLCSVTGARPSRAFQYVTQKSL